MPARKPKSKKPAREFLMPSLVIEVEGGCPFSAEAGNRLLRVIRALSSVKIESDHAEESGTQKTSA